MLPGCNVLTLRGGQDRCPDQFRALVKLLTLRFLPLLAALGIAWECGATEPLFEPHDVVAFVGGQTMVEISESGYLEAQLTRALPGYQLRFRSLAWEGDTVFEQRRDLNFPPLEEQLTRISATVVIVQFGQMESLGRMGEGRMSKSERASADELAEFTAAYEKLIDRVGGGENHHRRVLLLAPVSFEQNAGDLSEPMVSAYAQAAGKVGRGRGLPFIDFEGVQFPAREAQTIGRVLQSKASAGLAKRVCRLLKIGEANDPEPASDDELLRAKIIEKNRLWFHYWRPQNWAFLNGDRTVQPSSRDHLDPSKRWFPAEIEQFIPLIEAKEREIDDLAARVTKR